jgi:hypothetical protein
MKKEYCVYRHTTPNGKIYIGITSRKVEERWLNGRGYSYNHHFTNAINKYGWHNIRHEVIAEKLNETESKTMERFFIQMYKSYNPKYGYNKTLGGDDLSRFEKSVLQYSLDGKLIRRYGSMTEAAVITNTRISRISDCTKGNRFSTNGSIWLLEDDNQREVKLNKAIKEKKHPSAMCGGANHQARAIEQYTLDGTYIKTYPSAQTASDLLGIDYSTIKKCASTSNKDRASKSAGGFIWIHADETNKEEILKGKMNKGCEKAVSQYTLDGKHVRDFVSITEAKAFLNTNGKIGECARGERKTACGYIWKYA